jgi:histidine ammonia-lyase
MMKLVLTGKDLSIDQVYQVSRCQVGELKIELSSEALASMEKSKAYVKKIIQTGKPVYSINTGFGSLSSKKIENHDLNQLQVNLIRSHCTGVGQPFDEETTRAIMLLRANCLASGFSGVNPEIVKLLLTFLMRGIIPFVPCKGSVGASGDLAPLSHIALSLIGEGKVFYQKQLIETKIALKKENLSPIVLGPKDGLALINGTAVMTALGALAIAKSRRLVKLADVAACLTNEAVRGSSNAYDPLITSLKPHPGQIACNENLNLILTKSEIRDSHKNCEKVQDPYSIRCVPQVHGACRQTIMHATSVLDIELNAVTDNPLIFVDQDKVVSGGNFHGEAVAFALDYLAIGMAELCNISERRVEKMMNPIFSDLPHFLTNNAGLNSGLMIAHVTSAALASENKYLCHPASIDSIPTSTDKEDHVSMGVTAGRKLMEILDNLKHCLAIEFLCNTQAIEFLRPLKTNHGLEKVIELIRTKVPPIVQDRVFHEDIQSIADLIEKNKIIETIEDAIGELK